jgi:hypothetical protein
MLMATQTAPERHKSSEPVEPDEVDYGSEEGEV